MIEDESTIAEAFTLLGNETRVGTLRALWASHDQPDGAPVPYAELLDRVGTDDSGNFSYHLDRLVGHYVKQVGDGYVLTSAGEQVVRSILSGVVHEPPTTEPAAVDVACPFCRGGMTATYRDQQLLLRCEDCAGAYPDSPFPAGTISVFSLPPAALPDREPMELVAAAGTRAALALVSAANGTCPTCAARIDHEVWICPDHDDRDGACATCGSRVRVQVRHACTNCRRNLRAPAWMHTLWHPAVMTFFARQGVPYDPHGHELFFAHPVDRFTTERLTGEPIRTCVQATCGGETLEVTLDETLDVVGVER